MFEAIPAFFHNLLSEIRQGFLFFSGPLDIVAMVCDVLVTAALFYFILKLLRETRAWQLLKGVVFLIIVGQLLSLLGLQAISFLLNSSLSFLAIALLVLFQPELRKALETVGRNSINFMQTLPFESNQQGTGIDQLIEAIVLACEHMSRSYTGALILVERQTKLGEIIEKGQSVLLDADLTATMLEQIFYKGSPLHDGACIIRNQKIYAARCHVPLAETYRLRKDYGTRHRAAIGASEISDAIAIVCSEERGAISVALDGSLFSVKDADVLRSLLYRLLTPQQVTSESDNLNVWQRIKAFFKQRIEPSREIFADFASSPSPRVNDQNERSLKLQVKQAETAKSKLAALTKAKEPAQTQVEEAKNKAQALKVGDTTLELNLEANASDIANASANNQTANDVAKNADHDAFANATLNNATKSLHQRSKVEEYAITGVVEEVKQSNKRRQTHSRLEKLRNYSKRWTRSKNALKVVAFVMAISVWVYVQATTNPISTKRFNVILNVNATEMLDKYALDYRLSSWNSDVILVSRVRNLQGISNNEINAVIDLNELTKDDLRKLQALNNEQTGSLSIRLPIHVSIPERASYAYRLSSVTPQAIEIVFVPLHPRS